MTGLSKLGGGGGELLYGWSERDGEWGAGIWLSERIRQWVRVESFEVMVCLSDWIFFMLLD